MKPAVWCLPLMRPGGKIESSPAIYRRDSLEVKPVPEGRLNGVNEEVEPFKRPSGTPPPFSFTRR